MKMPMVSIVLPVYKVEAYLDRCLRSVVEQTYSDFEAILVDDGSPDHCPEMCDEWAKKDERIRVVHKPNGGVSSARNAGIEAARGQYLCFVDSDDTVEPDYLSVLLNTLGAADVVAANTKLCGSQSAAQPEYHAGVYTLEAFRSDLRNVTNYLLTNSIGNKLFKAQIIRENGLRFDTKLKMGEDMDFILRYFLACRTIAVTDRMVYNYMDNLGSAMKSYRSEYYEQRQVTMATLIRFFRLADSSELQKKKMRTELMLNVVNVELIENPARRCDRATLLQLLRENGLVDLVKALPLSACLSSRYLLVLKLRLYGVYAFRMNQLKKAKICNE